MEVEVKRKGKVRHEIVASQPYMWILGLLLRGAAIAYMYLHALGKTVTQS